MEIEYDWGKNEINIKKHQLSLSDVTKLNWSLARIGIDNRFDYGEVRYMAFLPDYGNRLHQVVFTKRTDKIRVISFRKANKREVKRYGN